MLDVTIVILVRIPRSTTPHQQKTTREDKM